MRTAQLILLIAAAVIAAVKSDVTCTYNNNTYPEGKLIYKDLCAYCVCNEAGELGDCGTDEGNCVESCDEGFLLQQQPEKCCPTCVSDGGN